MTVKLASTLQPGDYVATWFGTHRIATIEPYEGPLDLAGVVTFADGTQMTFAGSDWWPCVE